MEENHKIKRRDDIKRKDNLNKLGFYLVKKIKEYKDKKLYVSTLSRFKYI